MSGINISGFGKAPQRPSASKELAESAPHKLEDCELFEKLPSQILFDARMLSAEVTPSLIEKTVRKWAEATQKLAPPRHHLDYAQHIENCLPALIKMLEDL